MRTLMTCGVILAVTLPATAVDISISQHNHSAQEFPRDSLVRVQTNDSGRLNAIIGIRVIQGEPVLANVDIEFLSRQRAVFAAPPGNYVITGEENDLPFQRMIKIVGKPDPGPGPNPPPPDPDPPVPPPPPPVPDNISDIMGVGRITYTGVQGKPKTDIVNLATKISSIELGLHEGKLTPKMANDEFVAAMTALGWNDLWSTLSPAFNKSLEDHGRTMLAFKNLYHEIRLALEEAGK